MQELSLEINNLSLNGPIEKIKYIDLFAGTGAFSHVCDLMSKESSIRFECVFANDIEDSSEKIYTSNHSNNFTLKDLNDVEIDEIPSFDMLIGGFPCQPFSIAGKREGFNDKRSNVFWKILEIINKHKPKFILLENVKNLISHDNKNTFKVIEKELHNLGYYIKYQILDTCEITIIPHHRERIYIVGFLCEDTFNKFSFPEKRKCKMDNIVTYLQDENSIISKYYYTDKLKVFDEVKKSVTKNIETNTVYQYRRYYVRENKNSCVPTLTANMGSGGHNVPLVKDNNGIRKLTPRECFNFQGFPPDYILPNISDNKLYKLAGNAVSIPVIQKIFKQLENCLA